MSDRSGSSPVRAPARTAAPDGSATTALRIAARRPKLSERVAAAMATHIVQQDLQEGDQLPNERELIELFGVARGTLREALRLLEAQGIVVIRSGPHGGPAVRRPRPSDLAGSITLQLQLLQVPLAHVIEAREVIMPRIVVEAARNSTADDIARLLAQVERLRRAVGNLDHFLIENDRYHIELARIADNEVLGMFAGSLESIAAANGLFPDYSVRVRRAIVDAYVETIGAIASGDIEAVARNAETHMQQLRRYLERRHPEVLSRSVKWLAQGSDGR